MTSMSLPAATLETRTGLKLDMRLAEPADEPLLRQLFEGIPSQALRFRFIPVPDDRSFGFGGRLETLLAFSRGQLVSAAMLARDVSMENAEVVVALNSQWHGQGIGFTMLEYAVMEAKRRGVKVLWSVETLSNQSGMKAALEFGFSSRALEEDPSWVQLELRF
jgi:GNAT superfamily N-acetyltransferase